MRALVTGGGGFIGSHLTELLIRNGHEVIVLDNFSTGLRENLKSISVHPKLKIIEEDITKREKIFSYFKEVDWVFHLAAILGIVPSLENPSLFFDVNVGGTFNVCEACRLAKVKKIIYAASCSFYGKPRNLPISESEEVQLLSPYALTKYAGEQFLLKWGAIYKLPVVSLRLFNVYGPRASPGPYSSVMYRFIEKKRLGEACPVFGDGEQTRDFIHVKDVAEAFYKAAESTISGECFNVGTSAAISLNSLIKLLGVQPNYLPEREGDAKHSSADITKIKRMLGWMPKVSIQEGTALLLQE